MAVQEELAQYKKVNSEPVLEEFIPLKKIENDDDDKVEDDGKEKDVSSRDMKNWVSSFQLMLKCDDHQTSDSNTDYSSKKSSTNSDNNKKSKVS